MAEYNHEDLFDVKNLNVVIIGASGHICSEFARAYTGAQSNLFLIDVNKEKLSELTKKLKTDENIVEGVVADCTQKKSLQDALKIILSHTNKVDVVINGAGLNAPTPFLNIKENEWDSILDVILKATMFSCQVFGQHMVKTGSGSIINISSASSDPPLSKAFTYSVAKAGVVNLTKNLAREWAPNNVRVNCIRPGFFPTKWNLENFIDKKREEAILNHTPLNRFGTPDELVGAALFLSSKASSFVTGTELVVDGGFSCMTI